MFLTEKTKELSPKASLRWREGLFGGGSRGFCHQWESTD